MSNTTSIKTLINNTFEQVLSEYGLVIACVVVGIIIGWQMRGLLFGKRVEKVLRERIADKDDNIKALNRVIIERMDKVVVEKKDKTFFKKLMSVFGERKTRK